MNRFLLLMAAVASLFITACKKDDYSSLIGSWKGYSRSYTVLKNGQPVSPETFVRDLIKVGELEEPEDAKEMAEYIEEAKSAIYDEYLLEGDEDITLTFHNDGKLTSVFVDEKPETQHLTYSLSGKTLTIMDPSDPSETMVVTIVLLNQKEFAFTHDSSDTYRVDQSMKSLGYSMRSQAIVFVPSVYGLFRVLHLINPLAGNLSHPLFERLCLRRRNRLDEPEQLLLIGHIRLPSFTVRRNHFESVTICNGFIPLVFETLFQNTPIQCRIRTIRKHGNHINNREVPLLFLFVPSGSYFPVSKQLERFFLAHTNPVFCEVTKQIHQLQEEMPALSVSINRKILIFAGMEQAGAKPLGEAGKNSIRIRGARENNLKELSLDIPKYKITVFTGVSGSGKSSLVLDTLAAKSRRELNDTFPSFVQQYLPKYGRPHVDSIEGLPIAIVIDQKKPAQNSRSTVGTYTDTYSLMRLLFSRVGKPFVGYSDSFSFNHPQGSCPRCSGLGEIRELDIHKLVDFDKSLNDEDTIHYIAFGKGGWRWIRYAHSGLFDLDKKIKDYSPEELDLFLNSPQIKLKNPPSNWPKTAKYEGLVPRMYRSIINSEEGLLHAAVLNPMLTMGTCPDCGGTRLNPKVLNCKIEGLNIAQACALSISRLREWTAGLQDPLAVDLKEAIGARLAALEEIGLGYLSLDRAVGTLSGGEAQRCKIAKYINSSLSDVLYILDEPSVGLHNQDIERMKRSVRRLRDHGNTVLLVEHHKELIRIADHIVDLGPGPGSEGGRICFQGSWDALLQSGTATGRLMGESLPFKADVRPVTRCFHLSDASLHNLQNITVDIPLGVFGVVAGVAGSGKSSLMECFRAACPEDIVYISQKNIGVSLRSTPATYMEVAPDIRKAFARAHKLKEEYFSFNGKGACPLCGGKGVIVSEMAFMDSIETVCEACGGLRYGPQALQYTLRGMNIAQVMDLSVRKAMDFFADTPVAQKLRPLADVGLQYLHLNQALSTLSGGELQRLKLASFLGTEGKIFIIDEPTDGLHTQDIRHILALFDSLVERGNTVWLIEHNTDVIRSADYVIELGPGAGEEGGRILFCGPPSALLACPDSVTGRYL